MYAESVEHFNQIRLGEKLVKTRVSIYVIVVESNLVMKMLRYQV